MAIDYMLPSSSDFYVKLVFVQMGGRNTVLLDAISCRIPLVSDIPTIIFGADVTHPENGEDSSPSIAAVCVLINLLHPYSLKSINVSNTAFSYK